MNININDIGQLVNYLTFWHNKTDDECIEMATDEMGNVDAEKALTNIMERDLCVDINKEITKDLK